MWLALPPTTPLSHLQGLSYKIEEHSMILSEQDRGRTVEVPAGSVITVRLKENPTTGYRWSVEATNGLEQVGDRFEAGGAAIGAAGERVFQFRATRAGSHKLRLKNWREWEAEASVTDRFEANIIVK
jgi:predicted secreted protein